ncbi:carotenoid 1,2-hydratase [Gordonia sp. VNK1]|jgi:predicted secreted hydrolase|uniref:carotenoid 1,2-hydratase n=1 Tax=Gordonia oleivorans TaxID=3156618 RepID=UPI0032B60100
MAHPRSLTRPIAFRLGAWGVAAATCAVIAAGPAAADTHPGTYGDFAPIERSISLPRDESSHRQPAEWWYMTGHLTGVDPAGKTRHYGYEIVVFQIAAVAGVPPIYDSHFAISDLGRHKFSYAEHTTAGAYSTTPNAVDQDVAGFRITGSMGHYAASASQPGYSLDIRTTALVPPTLNGVNGIETFGDWVSPYYSYTSNATVGTLIDHGVPVKITGNSWYDHEWATGAPGTDGTGWSWFGVSLDNNVQYNLSFFQAPSGEVQKVIAVRTADGHYAPVPADQVSMQPIGAWRSPHTGYTYPTSWRITLPGGAITLTPKIQDSELSGGVGHKFYYEGPTTVTGTLDGAPATGNAYAEMNPRGVNWRPDQLLP